MISRSSVHDPSSSESLDDFSYSPCYPMCIKTVLYASYVASTSLIELVNAICGTATKPPTMHPLPEVSTNPPLKQRNKAKALREQCSQ